MRIGDIQLTPGALLAPMEAVTDLPFRTVAEELGSHDRDEAVARLGPLLGAPDPSVRSAAARGLGRACAIALAQAGADVALGYRDARADGGTTDAIRALGRRALPLQMDVTRGPEIEAAVAEAARAFGHIDILVNNAGINSDKTFVKMDHASWRKVLAINLDGVDDSVFRNNLLYDNHAFGISLFSTDGSHGSSRNKVYNNTIVGFKSGSSSQYGILIDGNSGGSGNEVRNNLFYDNVGTFTVAAGAATVSDNTVAGADPFVSYAGQNLHLSANTAAGTTLGAPYNTDIDGVTRGGPAAWSLGAYQFTGGGGGGGAAGRTGTMA